MELMTRCGRCGALVETTSERLSSGVVHYAPCAVATKISSNNVVVRDGCEYTVLCPDCMEQLKEWLAGESQEPQEAADSAERLAADMARVVAAMADDGDSMACHYFGRNVVPCTEFGGTTCPAYGCTGKTCAEFALEDFRRRCRALGIDLEEDEDAR